MLNDREAFIAALEANEDDEATRLIYADWLEEQGEYEEAERQRKWTGAKGWLLALLEESREEYDDEYEFNPSFRELCEMAQAAVDEMGGEAEEDDTGGVHLFCGNNMTLMETLQTNAQAFWENWSIVTGVRVPHDLGERSYFGCAC